MAEHDNTLAELDLKAVLARNYPYVNLTTGYGYGYNRYGTYREPFAQNAGAERRGAGRLHDLRRQPPPRTAQRPHGIENAQLTQRRLEQPLRADLSNFWQAYRNNLEVILLEEENLIAAMRITKSPWNATCWATCWHRDARGAEELAGRRGAHPSRRSTTPNCAKFRCSRSAAT